MCSSTEEQSKASDLQDQTMMEAIRSMEEIRSGEKQVRKTSTQPGINLEIAAVSRHRI